MKRPGFKAGFLMILFFGGVLPLAGISVSHLLLRHSQADNMPLHAVFEALGSLVAISLAIIILLRQKEENTSDYHVWIICALISMGILDGFHAASSPGDPFVWLHSTALLLGGLFFAMVWLPDRFAGAWPAAAFPIVTAIASIIVGAFSLIFSDMLPSMASAGSFTPVAKAINVLGGLFFMFAAAYFINLYRSDGHLHNFIFANFCLLNGWAGLSFQFSYIWSFDWWFWHFLRMTAFFIITAYFFITYQVKELQHEIAGHKRAVEMLNQERDTAQMYLDIAGVMFVVLDTDQRVTLINKKGREILGYPEDEIIGKNWFDNFLPEKIRREVKTACGKVMSGETEPAEYFENPVLTKNGEERFIAWHNTVVKNGEGKIIGTLSSGEDITERKIAETSLIEEKNKWESVISALGDGITIQDRNFRIIYQNQVAIDFMGNHIGEYCYKAYEGMEETCEGCPVAMSFADGGIHTTVRPVLTDKGMMYFENTSSPLRDAEGNIVAGIELVRNITDRKRVEEELKRSEESHKELTEVLGKALEDVKKREQILLKGRDAFFNMLEDVSESYKELTLAYEKTIEGWSRALDYRDKETEGHSERVTDLTVEIARGMGFNEEDLVHIRRGALLHDIGKLGVPDSVLLKPGKLTEEEWKIMKLHPKIAYEILSPIVFLQPAMDIPYCHHENLNGTGYPRGLKGDEIPLSARIFAVIDVWDALLSERPYRPPWPKEKVIDYIHSLSGIQFDPKVVEIFFKVVDKA